MRRGPALIAATLLLFFTVAGAAATSLAVDGGTVQVFVVDGGIAPSEPPVASVDTEPQSLPSDTTGTATAPSLDTGVAGSTPLFAIADTDGIVQVRLLRAQRDLGA